MSMPVIAQLRLSLGMVQLAMNMLREADRGRKSPISPQAAEILYTAYFSRIRMGDVAAMLGVSRSTATDHINYLEREGYVTREQDPDDRRAYRIVPTQKGEEWILTIEERLFAYLEEGMDRLTDDEQHEFARLSAKFTGVSDSDTFMSTLQELKQSRDRLHIPMKCVTDGQLMRLEDVTVRRYQNTSEKRYEQRKQEK